MKRKSTLTDGKRYFKASGADHGTKINVIWTKAHKYSGSAMCAVLDIQRSTYYYHTDLSSERARKAEDAALSKEIECIFHASCNNYGTRKIKKELRKLAELKQVSRRRIGCLMSKIQPT